MELDALEARIADLRRQVREAMAAGDRPRVRVLRAELRTTERAWDEALEPEPAPPALLPVRERVHQALTLLGVPTAAKLIVAVHEAFFAGHVTTSRLTSLRRDEERSFRTSPYARPYYLCAALTADLLSPARGLLATSTWPMATRVVGPLSSRTGFLTSAIRVAEHITRLRDAGEDASPSAYRLLTRMAQNIPGAVEGYGPADPAAVVAAAGAEFAVHEPADQALRSAAAERAVQRLDAAAQLFGAGLRTAKTARSERTA